MREAPIILPVFTTNVPLDFPLEGTFAFNKATNRQLEVTVRINEHQYFNMDFLNHDGYIMACCRWGHNSHNEERYRKCRKHAEAIVCLFYENLLSAKFVGIPAKRNYAAKIRNVIEEMMKEDWSNVQNGIE